MRRAGSSLVGGSTTPRARDAGPPPRVDLESPFVFLSYSSKDGELAHRLAAELNARLQGVCDAAGKVWYDQNEIQAGTEWDTQIGIGLRKCRVALFCLSPNFFDSVNCKGELKSIRRRCACAAG